MTKDEIIERLLSPFIIDLTNNIEYIEELENNLKDRVKEIQKSLSHNKREIKIRNLNFDIMVENKNLFEILKYVRDRLRPNTWELNYSLAKIYFEKNGNLEIPSKFKTLNGTDEDENGYNLGVWLVRQRQMYKKGKLSPERKELLNQIGMIWEIRKRKDKKQELCNEYLIPYEEVENISYNELYAKTMYLLDNNINIIIDDKLNPIYNMSNTNMKVTYGVSLEELIEKYLDEFYYNMVLDNYEYEYLKTLDEDNFKEVYNLLKKYNFYFINDIILNYIEIFELDTNLLEEKLNILKEELGDNYIYIIGNNMRYLEALLESAE